MGEGTPLARVAVSARRLILTGALSSFPAPLLFSFSSVPVRLPLAMTIHTSPWPAVDLPVCSVWDKGPSTLAQGPARGPGEPTHPQS